jgi:hypothetical protein
LCLLLRVMCDAQFQTRRKKQLRVYSAINEVETLRLIYYNLGGDDGMCAHRMSVFIHKRVARSVSDGGCCFWQYLQSHAILLAAGPTPAPFGFYGDGDLI